MNKSKLNDERVTFFEETIPISLRRDPNSTATSLLLTATKLFAADGFAAVSIRDIAKAVGMKAASIYNHYASKNDLVRDVVLHAEDFYLKYLSLVEARVEKAVTFDEVLNAIFDEPLRMENEFTLYGFYCVICGITHSDDAYFVYNKSFTLKSVEMYESVFKKCVQKGWIKLNETVLLAELVVNSFWTYIHLAAAQKLGKPVIVDPIKGLLSMQKYLRSLAVRTDDI